MPRDSSIYFWKFMKKPWTYSNHTTYCIIQPQALSFIAQLSSLRCQQNFRKETPTSAELKRSKVQGLLYHLEDGTRWLANPMFWFIMAPYLSPPNWGVAIAIYGLTIRKSWTTSHVFVCEKNELVVEPNHPEKYESKSGSSSPIFGVKITNSWVATT